MAKSLHSVYAPWYRLLTLSTDMNMHSFRNIYNGRYCFCLPIRMASLIYFTPSNTACFCSSRGKLRRLNNCETVHEIGLMKKNWWKKNCQKRNCINSHDLQCVKFLFHKPFPIPLIRPLIYLLTILKIHSCNIDKLFQCQHFIHRTRIV